MFNEQFVDQMLERVPVSYVRATWELLSAEHEPIGELMSGLDRPLLLAKHDGCLMFGDEGFEDVIAAFPEAQTVVTEKAPSADPGFAEALRSFSEEIADGSSNDAG